MKENNTPNSNKKIIEDENPKYLSKEHQDLDVPSVPIAPKKKERITSKSPGLSTDLIKKIKTLESNLVKVVLVNCERCGEIITVPITKISIDSSELPVVPISYVHLNSKGKDPHCITLFLDHDYDIRRQRISDVIIEKNLENR
ncbi:MAG: hypothetical protein EU532_14440 [Promethearchaeota archaeon]|nr:MAG: hypothetical protein EU532_14440 [Candidatus Lokiarchaeota archaeon]